MIDAQGNYVPDITPVTTVNSPVPAPLVPSSIPVPTPAQIYSSSNIAQATNAPVAMPDLSNASAIYDFYMNSAGVTGAMTTAQADQAALATAKATARNRQLAIEGQPLESQQFIVGQQARAGQLDNAALSALADTAAVSSANYASAKQTASEKANVALSQRSELVNMINQNPKAGITFNDTVVSASKKVSDYMDKVAKDAQDKADKEYTQKLKATMIELGISSKGLGTKGMEKKLTASYKSKAEAQKVLDSLKLQGAQLDLAKARQDLSNSGNAGNDKQTAAFFSDIEQQRAVLEKISTLATDGKAVDASSWSKAWNYINTKYPGLDASTIDKSLGLDYRKTIEGQ